MRFKLFIFILIFFLFHLPSVEAATIQKLSDTLSTPQPSSASSPIAAMHTVTFTPATAIPSGGKIILIFSKPANTSASASASTFSFNGLTTANAGSKISYNLGGPASPSLGGATCSLTVNAPNIVCSPSAAVPAGTQIKFLIGCADNSASVASCSNPSPILLNPTSPRDCTSSPQTSCSADVWTLRVTTQTSSSTDIDTGKTKIGTNPGVQIKASVQSRLSITVGGVPNNTKISLHNPACTNNNDKTNTGFATTPSLVDLGLLSSKKISVAAQDIVVTTNGYTGYTLTATAASSLKNVASNHQIATNQTPTRITAGTERFGLHACGTDAKTATFGTGSGTLIGSAKFAWPGAITPLTLASSTTPSDSAKTTVEYAATIGSNTPSGIYQTFITYTATASF